MWKLVFVIFACWMAPVQAEIQNVTVHWKGLSCNAVCAQMIYQQFQATPGVAGINLNPATQTVQLRWNPVVPFSYQAIKAAMQRIGPGIEYMQVKVRGIIRFQNNQFWMVSLGDNTPFALYGPIIGQPGGMTQYQSPVYHPLSPDMQAQLVQAAQQARVAIIEGALLNPDRSPPLMLIIGNLQIVQPELQPSPQPLQQPGVR